MPVLILILAAAAHGLLLSGVLALHPRAPDRAQARRLAALLACASAVSVIVVLQHAGLVYPESGFITIEESLTLLSGPLLLAYVRGGVHAAAPRPLAYLPWAAHAIGAVIAGAWMQRYIDVRALVFVQMAYTAAAARSYWRYRTMTPGGPRLEGMAWPIGIMLAVHAAQLIRLSFPQVDALEDIVPVTLSLAFLALQGNALLQSKALLGLSTSAPPASVLAAGQGDADRLAEHLRSSGAWRDPALSFEALCRDLGWEPAQLTLAIAHSGESGVHALLNRYRLAEAKRLLADPDEQRYAVEGIGRQAGFGSRSGFYKAFRADTRLSPAEYRRQRLESR